MKKELGEKERDFKSSSKQLFEDISELRQQLNEEKRKSKQMKLDFDQQIEMNDKSLSVWQRENEKLQKTVDNLKDAVGYHQNEIKDLDFKLSLEK